MSDGREGVQCIPRRKQTNYSSRKKKGGEGSTPVRVIKIGSCSQGRGGKSGEIIFQWVGVTLEKAITGKAKGASGANGSLSPSRLIPFGATNQPWPLHRGVQTIKSYQLCVKPPFQIEDSTLFTITLVILGRIYFLVIFFRIFKCNIKIGQ